MLRIWLRLVASLCPLWVGADGPSLSAQTADSIYHGGTIVTIDDERPLVEALAVHDGKILAVGPSTDVMKLKGDATRVIDLAGRAMVPGFIDSHGHMMNVGVQSAVATLLPPPDGPGASIADVQTALREWSASSASQRILGGKLIMGFGYDDAQLKERRHLTRHDLDAVSRDLPVVIVHQSGHLGVLNTKALEMVKLTAESKDPPGGVIRRDADGRTPSGVLEETAWIPLVFQIVLPAINPGNERYFLEQGQAAYTRFGFTTAQEGRANAANVATLADAATSGLLEIDVVAYPDAFLVPDATDSPWYGREYKGHFRIGGVKFNLDGSVQGKTAWLTQPYKVPPEGQGPDYKGYPSHKDAQLFPAVKQVIAKNCQLLAHCNGDAACEQLLNALRQAGSAEQVKATRPVMIHAQTVREDQLDAMAEYGVIPSFFSMHTYYWGDWHLDETLGEERAMRISPAASTLRRQMVFTTHHDAPVALPDSIRILSSCVSRKSRSGRVIGEEQRISMLDALKALTLYGAYQCGEEDRKGSLEVGKLADLVILSADPLTIDPDRIMELQVVETIKEGQTVYPRKP